MATIKLIFRVSSHPQGEGTLYLRIIHNRQVCQIHTGYRIYPDEWDARTSTIKHTGIPSRDKRLDTLKVGIRHAMQRLEAIITSLEHTGTEYSVAEILEHYQSSDAVIGFISFARKHIRATRQLGRSTTAEHYASALNSLIRYIGDNEISFESFDSQFIAEYETYLRHLNLCPNTTSYYMRNLRSIYNHAVEQNITVCRDPFRHVYTGVEKTVKRSVPVEMVKILLNLDLSRDESQELARDMFIFSLYTRGMAFIDMVYLKKTNIKNGILTYRRHKTSQSLHIRWEKPMQKIAEKYSVEKSDYIFPLITQDTIDTRRRYLSAYKSLSRRLKRIGEMIGLPDALTFHRARHTWASTARENKVPVSVIQAGMGHDSARTTQIYLDSLYTDEVDNANSFIIRLLNS